MAVQPPRGMTRYTSVIQEDGKGNFFLSDRSGVQRRLAGSTDWERIDDYAELEMFRAADGTVWAADPLFFQITKGGLLHHDVVNHEFPEGIRAATCDQSGQFWAAAKNQIYKFDQVFEKVHTTRSLPGQVNVLLVDREKNVWAGTTAGLACLTRQLFSSLTAADGLVNDDVWSISEAPDGALWIGTSGGVSRWKKGVLSNYIPHGIPASAFPNLRSAQVALALKNGEVWTTPGGLLCQVYPFPSEVPRGDDGRGVRGLPFFEDEDSSVWVQQEWVPVYGPILRKWKNEQFELGFNPTNGVYSILRDRSHRLWIGTQGNGIFVIENDRTNHLTTVNGLTSNFCGPVLADSDGAVWIASDKGLNRWKDGRITRYTPEDGLLEGTILNVLEDDFGFLWLNGERGIYRVRKQELTDFADAKISRIQVIAYDEADGLSSSEGNGGRLPNSCKDRQGKLWFPTIKGITVIDPAELRLAPAPRAVITEISLDKKTIYADGKGLSDLVSPSRFGPGRGEVLRIRYTAPDFRPSPQLRFYHKLDHQDKDWVEDKDDRYSLYTNLRPGAYRYQVRAVSAEASMSEPGEPATFSFVLEPHFYQTWPFYLLCALSSLALVGIAHTRRLSIQRHVLNLERQSALEDERSRIAADIHDTLGADFSRITLLAERLRQGNGAGDSAASTIAQTVRHMGNSMSELIWATNSNNDTLDNLLSYIRAHAAETCDSAGIKLVADTPASASGHISGFVRHQIYLIFREALNNIIKHAGATEVRLRIDLVDDSFHLELSDDGCGFSPENTSRWNNGHASLRRRAANINAELITESRPGRGTTVRLKMPFKNLSESP
jgi:signal transduction histidine kinase/ligand-binding sensor domain-containing protein